MEVKDITSEERQSEWTICKIDFKWDPAGSNTILFPRQHKKFEEAARDLPHIIFMGFEIIDSDNNIAQLRYVAKTKDRTKGQLIGKQFFVGNQLDGAAITGAMVHFAWKIMPAALALDLVGRGYDEYKHLLPKALTEKIDEGLNFLTGDEEGDDDAAADAAEMKSFRFQQQCFLSTYLDIFAAENSSKTYPNFVQIGKSTKNNFLSAGEVVEKLTAVPDLGNIMRIPPAVLSTLTPQVRLYKVRKKAGETKPQEFIFNDHLSPECVGRMTMSAHARGQGVGLKSFKWIKDGRNPGERNNSIQVKMVLHFSSMLDLTAELDCRDPEPGGGKIRWIDLISPSVSSVTSNKSNTGKDICGQPSREQNLESFKIRAVIGYNKPTPSMWKPFGLVKEELEEMSKAVSNCQTSLYLTFIKHDIVLKEGGAIELTIQYMAALEGILSDKKADVFLLGLNQEQRKEIFETGRYSTREEFDKQIAFQQKWIKKIEEKYCQNPNDPLWKNKENFIKMRERRIAMIERARDNETGRRHQQILEILERKGRVFKISVNAEDVGRLKGVQDSTINAVRRRRRNNKTAKGIAEQVMNGRNQIDSSTSMDSVQAAAAKQTVADAKKQSEEGKDRIVAAIATQTNDPADKTELEIPYIYYGDLLDVALTVLKPVELGGVGGDSSKELKLIVGAYSFTDLQTGNQKSVNLADIPISLERFKVWFLENIVKTNREQYPLKAFIRDTITGLISDAMTPRCFGFEHGYQISPKIGISVFEAPMLGNPNNPTDRVHPGAGSSSVDFGNLRIGVDEIKPFPPLIGKETNMGSYLLIYCSSASSRQLKSDEGIDNKAGRYWLRFGATGGLVKNIKFKKQNQPGTREMRLERMGNLDKSYLHDIYDADITLYGCPVFSPGCMVYVDPASVGIGPPSDIRELAQRLGMGGYYLILEATSVIEPGKFETFLKTKFESPGDICGTGQGVALITTDQSQDDEDCAHPNHGGRAVDLTVSDAIGNALSGAANAVVKLVSGGDSTPKPISLESNLPPEGF